MITMTATKTSQIIATLANMIWGIISIQEKLFMAWKLKKLDFDLSKYLQCYFEHLAFHYSYQNYLSTKPIVDYQFQGEHCYICKLWIGGM